jgi:hypothetical protein
MKTTKANARDKKRKKRNNMIVTGKSVFAIQQEQIKRAEKTGDKK